MTIMIMISLVYLDTIKLTRTTIKSIIITTTIFHLDILLSKVKKKKTKLFVGDAENSSPHLRPHLCSLRLTSKRAAAAAAITTAVTVSSDSCC
ncbi:hypothetical protein YC2023_058273 [Brassica napus]